MIGELVVCDRCDGEDKVMPNEEWLGNSLTYTVKERSESRTSHTVTSTTKFEAKKIDLCWDCWKEFLEFMECRRD